MIDKNLLWLRKSNGYSQEEVAEKIGVSRQAVAKWENGESVPDIYNCMALAKLYHVQLDDLLKHEDEMNGAQIPLNGGGKHVFGVLRVGERGQIVIPKRAREIFHIEPGDNLLLLGDEAQNGMAIVKTEVFAEQEEKILRTIPHPKKRAVRQEKEGET